MLLFLNLVPVLSLNTEINCQAYTCKLPIDYFVNDTCVMYRNTTIVPTYYIRTCTDQKYSFCPPSEKSNSTCTELPFVTNYKYPGEKCHYNQECDPHLYGCEDETCQGKSLGGLCDEHSDCNPGLRCFEGICNKQIDIGITGCKTDYDCVNNAGCDNSNSATEGTCIKYWSLTDNSFISSCENYSNFLCKSSTCRENSCVPAFKSSKIPKKCSTDVDCISSDTVATSTCTCGKNQNANKYCALFYGDDPYLKYLELLQIWVNSLYVFQCNTERRFSYICAGDRWDRKKSYYMNYYLYFSQEFPSVIEYNDCVAQVYLSDFLFVKGLLENIGVVVSSAYGLIIGLWFVKFI